jgi:tuftelin-interacting protein 11
MYSSKEWDELMLRFVVPKLGATLRDDFTINPRKQDMIPLEDWVMPWHTLLRGSTFSQLIEANFAQKWLDILYIWLIQPNYKSDEVANW